MPSNTEATKALALCGGIGGAKLVLGLANLLSGSDLRVAINTSDDFAHLGLHISPDVDTVMYTLAGLSHPERGWGLVDESWQAMQMLKRYDAANWFQLGDRDLATHIVRKQWLTQGKSLSETTHYLSRQLGVTASLLPMSNDPVATVVETPDGDLPFQEYFVKQQCQPVCTGLRYQGAEQAEPLPEILAAINDPELSAIVVCPSNPFLSVQPILELPGLKTALQQSTTPVIVISPIVAGDAIKGPTAKMMQELDLPCSALSIAKYYQDIADGFVLDHSDIDLTNQVAKLGIAPLVCATVMRDLDDKIELAQSVLRFAREIGNVRRERKLQ